MRWTAAEDAELRKLRDDNVRCISPSCLLKFYFWFLFVKISVRLLSTVGLRGMFWWQCSIVIKKRTNSEPNVPSRRDGENCKRRSSTTLRNISPLGLYLKYDAPHNNCYPDFVKVTVTTNSCNHYQVSC